MQYFLCHTIPPQCLSTLYSIFFSRCRKAGNGDSENSFKQIQVPEVFHIRSRVATTSE